MHRDVAIPLDLAAGPGRLPLSAEPLRRACRTFGLTWTARDALRVLADVADEPAASREPASTRSFTLPWQRPDDHASALRPRRLPKLAPRRPQPAQLSLFD